MGSDESRRGTLDYSNIEMMRGLKVLVARKHILELCKDGQDALTTLTHKRDSQGNTMERRKAVNVAAALLSSETALASDELNVHLHRQCCQLVRYVNAKARKITRKQVLNFTTELMRTTGEWEEVTAEV